MTSATPALSARRRILAFIAIPLLALVALAGWAYSSPVGSSPDDDFHLVSIWCGAAADPEFCAPGAAESERLVSPDLFSSAYCFVAGPGVSADCQRFLPDQGEVLRPTERGNFEQLYPPVYYFAMSAFAGHDIQISVLTIRIVNSVLFVGLVTLLCFLLPARRRPTLVAAIAVTVVPLGMFLIPSTNPSSWAILSASTLWIALLGYYESRGWRRIALGAVAVLALVVGAGARADSAIYAGVAIVAVVVLCASRTRDFLLASILPAVLGVVALALFLSAGQSSAASTGLVDNTQPVYNNYTLLIGNLLELPWLLTGPFGTWKLGWLDTLLPAFVPFAAVAALGVALLAGIADRGRRKTIVALFVLVLVVLVPFYLLYSSDAIVGTQVQPRYVLPLIILLVGIVLLRVAETPVPTPRWQAWFVAAALTLANSVALHTNLRRYTTGVDAIGGNLDNGPEWWWTLPVSPMGVWAIGTLALGATLFWLASLWNSRATRPVPAPIGATV